MDGDLSSGAWDWEAEMRSLYGLYMYKARSNEPGVLGVHVAGVLWF